MKRARRGQPPATQLSREITEVGEEEEIGVPEPVCGGTAVDVVSSPRILQTTGKPWLNWDTRKRGRSLCQPPSPKQFPRVPKGLL
ncbi:hypothetical protein AXF42_Ash021457 [Apostasia shenzhenica]|uniref:Uncharacterized protein n=1 Tax=Apostasia shenzhenica TaxID=1088818 RepID=A0A2H9ZSU4_9ASPA|nr:hypothetical protein AXF42_Ash021457 [Apostasia shenzhenica]